MPASRLPNAINLDRGKEREGERTEGEQEKERSAKHGGWSWHHGVLQWIHFSVKALLYNTDIQQIFVPQIHLHVLTHTQKRMSDFGL